MTTHEERVAYLRSIGIDPTPEAAVPAATDPRIRFPATYRGMSLDEARAAYADDQLRLRYPGMYGDEREDATW